MVSIKVAPTDEFEGCESIELWEGHDEPIPFTVLSQLERYKITTIHRF